MHSCSPTSQPLSLLGVPDTVPVFSAPGVIITVIIFPFINVLWLLIGVGLIQAIYRDVEAATIPLLNIDCMPRRMLAHPNAEPVS